MSVKTVGMKLNSKLLLWAVLVAGLTLACFSPVLRGEFLYWDDDGLFVRNPYFRGLGLAHWQWMCSTFFFGHWQPLSWLSYALDYKAWGMNPHGWHAANLLLHTVNSVLVYLLCLPFLKEQKGRYAAAVMATLFWAVHPLRVETVAWLATRGYLLCTTFCLLTVLFYLRAVKQKRYPLAALLCFTLATCTKGVGMMLPAVLLLIDWAPFRRITSVRTALSCTIEKFPFFGLSLLTGITAFLAKKFDGGMMPVEHYGLIQRFGQAVYGIWFYLLKTVFPFNLAPLYDKRPEHGSVMVSLVLTAATAIVLFLLRRKIRPVLVTVGALLLLIFPMLGFTQSGTQLFADRFTYLATIPVSILMAAGLILLVPMRRLIYGALAALLVLFGVQTAIWAVSWNNNLTLWWRAVSVDGSNAKAYNSAGLALMDCQQYEKALECFEHAIQLRPSILTLHNRALALAMLGRFDEAFSGWEIALSVPETPNELRAKMLWIRGWVFEQTGNLKAAESDYSSVAEDCAVDPVQRVDTLQLRAALYERIGQKEKALADLEAVLKLPDPFGSQRQKAQEAIRRISNADKE